MKMLSLCKGIAFAFFVSVSWLPAQAQSASFTLAGANLPGVALGSVAWGDFNNDGKLDLLITGSDADGNPISQIWFCLGNGTFTNGNAGLTGVENGSVALGDFDNDGRLDILLTGFAGYDTNGQPIVVSQVWRNLGNGVFTNINAGLPGVAYGSVAWGDFDNDGKLDILLTGQTGHGTSGADLAIAQVWRNLGNGVFTNINAGLPGVEFGSVACGDFDNDGRLDILLTGSKVDGTEISQVWRNLGNGSFADIGAGLTGVYDSSVAVGDFDNDGRVDILLTGVAGFDANGPVLTSQVWRNLGSGGFTNINAGLTPVQYGTAAWGDFDNDGRLDILLTGCLSDGVTLVAQVWRNLGNGAFTNLNAGFAGTYQGSVAAGDYNNDGKLDIFLTGYDVDGDPASQLWQNNTAVANTPPAAPTGLSVLYTSSGVLLGWNAAVDAETPAAGLSYNLRVGSTPGGSDIVSPEGDASTGLRLLPQAGNAGQNLAAILDNLIPGNYFWSVQAVDSTFAGSPFAAEGTFESKLHIASVASLPGGQFQVQFNARAGSSYTLQASRNFVQWVNLTNFTPSTSGLIQFTDRTAPNFPRRFYRLSNP